MNEEAPELSGASSLLPVEFYRFFAKAGFVPFLLGEAFTVIFPAGFGAAFTEQETIIEELHHYVFDTRPATG